LDSRQTEVFLGQGDDEHSMNLFSNIPNNLPNEITETLVQAQNIHIERIVSQGHSSPDGFWYDQIENEFVLVIQGYARLRFEDEVIEMKAGDWINIQAHRKHLVEWTIPRLLLQILDNQSR
jgi:cupin 2 domain-containing protein